MLLNRKSPSFATAADLKMYFGELGRSLTIYRVNGGDVNSPYYANIPIILQLTEGKTVCFKIEVHVFDKLPVPFLFKN